MITKFKINCNQCGFVFKIKIYSDFEHDKLYCPNCGRWLRNACYI